MWSSGRWSHKNNTKADSLPCWSRGFCQRSPSHAGGRGERSPVIFVTGSSTLKRQGAGFKEIDDVALQLLVKYSVRISDGERISDLSTAWTAATSSCRDLSYFFTCRHHVFFFEADAGLSERPFNERTARPSRMARSLRVGAYLTLVGRAKRPVIIGGHGVWWSKSERQLEETGKARRIPISNVPYRQIAREDQRPIWALRIFHQYHPGKEAIHEADLVLMIGGRLDNQMNFGNPPFFTNTQTLVCINGSHEELEYNQAADEVLLSTRAFLEALNSLDRTWDDWFELQRERRENWVAHWVIMS